MVPAFGFSVGDFINAIGLINQVRKALKDVGGAEDDIRTVLQELQQLELLLTQLRDGHWGHGGDISHVNAIRGVALSCESFLKDFLRKVEGFHAAVSSKPGSSAKAVTRGYKQVRWAVSMKEEVHQLRLLVLSKLVTVNVLLAIPIE